MKRIFCIIMSLLMLFAVPFASGCSENRGEILKICNWGEYMDPEIYAEFEAWYEEQTGKKITVVESEFLTCENLITEIEIDKADYDLVCPSDYAIERMINKGLLQKRDTSRIDVNTVMKPDYVEVTKNFDPTLEYAVPYLYGTFGIMYDYSKTGEHIDSWDSIYGGGKYKGKCSTKKSLRDAYASVCIYNAREELSALTNGWTDYGKDYQDRLAAIYLDTSDQTIAMAKQTLMKTKKYITKWDEEDVKFTMSAGTTSIEVALMWSCDAGYVMDDYEDNNGYEQSGNSNLWYTIPKEGGNVYIDAFVIPKYAVNVEAANMFLEFICREEIAYINSEYSGSMTPVASAYDILKEEYSDESGYEDVTREWIDMYIDMKFPSSETLKRCGVMRDFKSRERAVATMWSQVVE